MTRPWFLRAAVFLAAFLVGTNQALAVPDSAVYAASGNTVQVIDVATNSIRASIPVAGPSTVIVASAVGTRVYAVHPTLDQISVLDPATAAVVGTIAVGDAPSAAILAPSGDWLYVLTAGGVVQVVDTVLNNVVASVSTGGSGPGDLALTADGARLYVAAGSISAVDTASLSYVGSFLPSGYQAVEVLPDGSRLYAVRNSFAGNVDVIDPVAMAVVTTIPLTSPGFMAMTHDGSRLYVSLAGTFVSTGWTGFFAPGRFISVIDTLSNTVGANIDLGNTTAAGLTVTPDRRRVYASVSTGVAAADVNTNAVVAIVPMSAPGALAASGDGSGYVEPYVIDAVDDVAPASVSAGPAVANVLANDTLGGLRPTLLHVELTQESSSDPDVTLDLATGAVVVAPGAALGPHVLGYRICERASPTNCDSATVTLTVRDPYPIDAVDDAATTVPGRTAVPNVLVNDTLNGLPATTSTVRLSVVSTSAATITLNTSTGAVVVLAGTPAGSHQLVYRMCEVTSLLNCDSATVTLTVTALPIDAVDDAGTITRAGGVAVGNVLVNDRFNGLAATTTNVRLFLVSSSSAGVTLTATSGAVSVAPGTAVGTYSLVYRICEAASPSNCDQATVSITVTPYLIDAVNDNVPRAYSKPVSPVVILANVLANDWLGNVRPTTATVRLTQVSSTSPNIVLDTQTGAVRLLRKTDSGNHALVYRICEVGNLTNCDQATVTIYLSGSGG